MEHAFETFHTGLEAAAGALGSAPEPFVELLRHGSMRVEWYAPRGVDRQQPHRQDELYVVARGSGEFVNGPRRHHFRAGDVMFVPAGVVHRFENFSEDFGVWVIFYGPDGGEAGTAR